MFLGIDWGPWLDRVFVGATILTIAAGVLGFAKEHRAPEGKLTPAGKALAVVVIAAGFLTLVLGLADRRIADDKERRADEERLRQFRSQTAELSRVMGTLQGVSGSMTHVQGNMQKSLLSQRQLYGVAERNLHASAALQQQTQANTARVLRSVFEESNRISPDRIAILANFTCPPTPLGISGAELYGARLIVTDEEGRRSTFFTREKLTLAAGTMFHGFVGHLGPLESFSAWANARISIEFDVGTPGGMMSIDVLGRMTREDIEAWRRSLPATYVCPGSTILLLNGRQVLTASSTLRYFNESDFGMTALNLRIDRSRLPRLPD